MIDLHHSSHLGKMMTVNGVTNDYILSPEVLSLRGSAKDWATSYVYSWGKLRMYPQVENF
jgi:hypothetical protein